MVRTCTSRVMTREKPDFDPTKSMRSASPNSHGFLSSKMSPTKPMWKGEQDLFMTLRYRLDQMEYLEYLHVDSVDLVQRLLSDLIQTTESARNFKNQLEIARNEKAIAEEQLYPLRQELTRLTAENNQLHLYPI